MKKPVIMENSRIKLTIVKSSQGMSRIQQVKLFTKIKNLKKELKGQDLSGEGEDEDGNGDRSNLQQLRDQLSSHGTKQYEISVNFKRYNYTTYLVFGFYAPNNDKIGDQKLRFVTALKKQLQQALSQYRKTLKRKDIDMPISKYMFKAMDRNVFSESNQIYAIFVKKKIKELYNEKLPDKPQKYIGLELEFCVPMTELDLSLKLFESGIHKFAQLKKDGSLRPKLGEFPFELALLLPESNYRKNLRTVCNLLNKVGAKANDRRCGVHVHLDMRRRKKDIVYNNLVACQEVLFKFIDPSRRNNEFCHTVESRKFPTHFNNDRHERYKSINAAAFYKYKTLEVRMHEGSVNFNELANWIQLLVRIGNHKSKIKYDVSNLTSLKKRISLDKKISDFFQDRTCFWQLKNDRPEGIAMAAREWGRAAATDAIDRIMTTPRAVPIFATPAQAPPIAAEVRTVAREELVAEFARPNNDDPVPF